MPSRHQVKAHCCQSLEDECVNRSISFQSVAPQRLTMTISNPIKIMTIHSCTSQGSKLVSHNLAESKATHQVLAMAGLRVVFQHF